LVCEGGVALRTVDTHPPCTGFLVRPERIGRATISEPAFSGAGGGRRVHRIETPNPAMTPLRFNDFEGVPSRFEYLAMAPAGTQGPAIMNPGEKRPGRPLRHLPGRNTRATETRLPLLGILLRCRGGIGHQLTVVVAL